MEAPVRGALSSRSSCHSGPSRPKGFAYRGVSARPVSQRNEGLLVEVDRGKAVAALCPRSLSALATVSTLQAATPDVQLLPVKFVGVRLPLLSQRPSLPEAPKRMAVQFYGCTMRYRRGPAVCSNDLVLRQSIV